MKHVLLVTDRYVTGGVSTQIMINNIIEGFVDAGCSLSVLFISEKSEEEPIRAFYDRVVSEFRVHEALTPRKSGKYKHLLCSLKVRLARKHLSAEEKNWIRKQMRDDTIIISHSPHFESVYICNEIRKEFPNRYIQYWSDPVAMSGILPEQMNVKRLPYYLLEKDAIASADEIVYGTKNLYVFQKELFKKYRDKMRWVEVAYCKNNIGTENYRSDNSIHLVYSGDYSSYIRNIQPLYEAMKGAPENCRLSIYGNSDLVLQSQNNISIHNRVSHEEVVKVENTADIMVCLLNKNCIQVPGKIFYNTNSAQRILVLVDGKYGQLIKEDLEQYGRFEFCENKKEAIEYWLQTEAGRSKSFGSTDHLEKLSPKRVSLEILEGDLKGSCQQAHSEAEH